MTSKAGSSALPLVTGNKHFPWALFVTGEAIGHLGIFWFPRSLSDVSIWANEVAHLWREWVYALLFWPYQEVLRVNRAVCHVKVWSLYSIINPNNRVNDKHGILLYPPRASACFKCHRNNLTLPSGCLYKCLCIPECRIGTKQPNSFTQLSEKRPRSSLAFTCSHGFLEAANTSLEQPMH